MKKLPGLLILTFIAVLAGCKDQPAETMERSIVIGHRGASHYAPENTVASAKLAWQQNADAVEVDVHLSADNQIVVIHDKNTKRTAGKNYVVSQTSMDTLRTLEAGSFKDEKYRGEPIPVLNDVVETLPEGKKLVVEIKSDKKIVPVLKEEFADHEKIDQFVFIAFNYETIVEAKKTFPSNEAYWLSSKFTEDVQTILQRVKDDGLDGVNLNHNIITPEIVKKANELGLEVYAWTVNDLEKAKKLQQMGVKGITTDMPDQVLAVLENDQAGFTE